jgi:hypothetical protein
MGLDQYWYVSEPKQFAYHRKFNALQGFMEEMFREQEGEGDFNCRDVIITKEILDQLEARIKEDRLEPTSGFFFGNTDKDDWYRQDVEELMDTVIPEARKYLEEGKKVVYTSWW